MTGLVDHAAPVSSVQPRPPHARCEHGGPPRYTGEHAIDTILGNGTGQPTRWSVEVYPTASGVAIERCVLLNKAENCPDDTWELWDPANRWQPERVIWPAWSMQSGDGGTPAEGTALESAHESWRNSSDRIRDSAKWMATVIGVTLAAIVGTSPLAVLWERSSGLVGMALGMAFAGLLLLATTMVLVLRVLRPSDTSYVDVQVAPLPTDEDPIKLPGRSDKGPRGGLFGKPLSKWRYSVETQQDLWLPSGVKCLTTLRQAMIVDELTLMALSCAARHENVTPDDVITLQRAQAVRVARLLEFKQAAARIVAIGEFYRVRHRSDWATYVGGAMGVTGTILIILAFAALR